MSKQTEKKLVPKLRFSEFQDFGEWGQEKLKVLANRITQKNKNSTITRVLTNSAANGVIDQRDFFDKDIANKGNLAGYFIVDEGDYVYNPRVSNIAPVGPISKNKIGKGIMSPLYIVFRFKNIHNDFYEQYFKSTHWYDCLRMLSNTGARHDRMSITPNAFDEMPLPAPHPKEQQKIADCLISIDELIDIHSQKLDSLKDYKKGLLQQLFPAEGEAIPKLRFSEFRNNGVWKEQSLNKITTEILDGDWIESKDQASSGIRLIQTGNIGVGEFIPKDNSKRFISLETFRRLNCTEVFPGDCLISRLPDPAGRSCLIPKTDCRMITAVDCTIIRFDMNEINPYIFVLHTQTERYFNEVKSLCSGSTRQRISKSFLSELKFFFPKMPEQQKIADCIFPIDKLIVAQSQKIDALRDHKRGLMQQLLPSIDEENV